MNKTLITLLVALSTNLAFGSTVHKTKEPTAQAGGD